MKIVLGLVSLIGGVGAAIMALRALEPVKIAAEARGGLLGRWADSTYYFATTLAFFAGGFATRHILLWIG